ncbi:sodium-coupled monocarboxylate transporter 2 [Balaenoptera musculus]|uniref:Sodium-coupled monocarboxylate transporter 2 n=1 Tax=Balaenoptera musculus TaxID=9771 RepID=A0A8B8Y5V1_BALMU|nr:sodium-coupled monocarboxylate transporter 2 [Balaenoptera musculus]
MEVKNFEVWDYVVFAALFVISSGIGVFFAIRERKKATSREFLVGGRQMTFGPVALSLTASFMSAVTVLGTPAEVYRFGASFILFFIAYAFVIIFTSELFLPVFYRSGITSTYEVRQLLPSSSLWEYLKETKDRNDEHQRIKHNTVAASINALATVTFEDFVKSCFPHLSDKLSTWISKGLCLLFGVICTSMAVAASLLGSVVQAALSIHGMCGGPMLGLFSLGILFPSVNWKGALGGLLTGIILSFWVAIGALIYPAPTSKTWPLPLSTDQCVPSNVTESVPPLLSSRPAIAETWYALSYLYYSAVGCLGCMAAGVIISFATGHQKGKDIQPLLIRPVCNLFCFWSKKYKTLCWCGVQHDSETEQENLENGTTWKQGAESVLRNGLRRESLAHVPGYDPKDKNYDNMAFEKITHF